MFPAYYNGPPPPDTANNQPVKVETVTIAKKCTYLHNLTYPPASRIRKRTYSHVRTCMDVHNMYVCVSVCS